MAWTPRDRAPSGRAGSPRTGSDPGTSWCGSPLSRATRHRVVREDRTHSRTHTRTTEPHDGTAPGAKECPPTAWTARYRVDPAEDRTWISA